MSAKKAAPAVDLTLLRRRILTAVASDDLLVEQLVLKGGNALELIHRIGERASLDLDFSMEGDVEDSAELERRLRRAVEDRLDSIGYVVFDWRFGPRPQTGGDPRWGGYRAEFKLIARDLFRQLNGELDSLRRQAQEIGPGHQRIFTIDISKFEFCKGNVVANVENYECHVYTPAMIAAEKVRALCQQMPEYPSRRTSSPRPRDFYDIHAIATVAGVRLADHVDILRHMFAAKEVPTSLARLLPREREREFHRQGWETVVQSVRGEAEPFDFYFDFVATETVTLQALWEEDAPLG